MQIPGYSVSALAAQEINDLYDEIARANSIIHGAFLACDGLHVKGADAIGFVLIEAQTRLDAVLERLNAFRPDTQQAAA